MYFAILFQMTLQNHHKARVSVIATSLILSILPVSLVLIDLLAVQYVCQRSNPRKAEQPENDRVAFVVERTFSTWIDKC